MLPMECPQCRSSSNRTPITNGLLADQVVRKRVCLDCGHRWFTVEVMVPEYAVGWSALHKNKPVLRVPMELVAGATRLRLEHIEAQDTFAALQAFNERRSEIATDCEQPIA